MILYYIVYSSHFIIIADRNYALLDLDVTLITCVVITIFKSSLKILESNKVVGIVVSVCIVFAV